MFLSLLILITNIVFFHEILLNTFNITDTDSFIIEKICLTFSLNPYFMSLIENSFEIFAKHNWYSFISGTFTLNCWISKPLGYKKLHYSVDLDKSSFWT